MVSAIFVGDGSLLIECAKEFSRRGGTVSAILTDDLRIETWAQAQGYRQAGTATKPDLNGLTGYYLFSIANLKILSPDLLACASNKAVNFHDGPLPSYAGLNVTSWAILAGESTHAVTWHEMTATVDAGMILAQRKFDIADDETAFSLNTKCFEAGVAAFDDLLDALFKDGLQGVPQTGQRRWYGKSKLPEGGGLLDFGRSAAELSALVRALDFGNYANTLTVPKIALNDQVIVVRRLEVLAETSAIAGTVLETSSDSVTVATADQAVVLSALETLSGQVVSPLALGAKVGQLLGGRPVTMRTTNADLYWIDILGRAKAAPLAFSTTTNGRSDQITTADLTLPHGLGVATANAGFATWLALLSGETQFSLAVFSAGGAFPCEFTLVANATVNETVATFVATLAKAQTIGSVSEEFVARLPSGQPRAHALDVLSVGVSDGATFGFVPRLILALTNSGARLIGRSDLYDAASIAQAAQCLEVFLAEIAAGSNSLVTQLPIGGRSDLNGDLVEIVSNSRIDLAFSDQARKSPEHLALVAGPVSLTYAELDAKSSILAGALAAKGAKTGVVVGLCLPRSADLIVAMLAILKTGAAYLPLDPEYPSDRTGFMLADSEASLIVAGASQAKKFGMDASKVVAPDTVGSNMAAVAGTGDDLAYLIYTSGSTGTPKGVMVSHQNVVNFMAGMDAEVPRKPDDRLLAVTSVSFDISVLEIFWTLTRGMTVVLQTDGQGATGSPHFSLFYFASEAAGSGQHAYRLLLEGAKFADENGFEAVWTPERHFHAFGGLYPNPAISSAAVAGFTRNVKIRAGSIVLPLHHPVRAAEDWALVDNISGGRAGMAVASGWQPNDFILQPQNFDNRKDVMLDSIDTLRALWRGESVDFPNHKGEMIKTTTLPRPVNGTIPLWITAAGNPETFAAAARKGCAVLTHLLGQTFDEVAEKIRAYRVAWAEAGHQGNGTVTLMLHTFVGDDEESVRETVRLPMRSYLKSAVDLIKRASWSFPTFVQKADASGMTPQQVFEKEELSKEETDALLDHAFDRYYRDSGLFGTPESCVEIVRKVAAIGVDEIACLIDFGVDTDLALAHLHHIKALMDNVKAAGDVSRKASVAEHIVENAITHLQCTPSAASMLVADAPGRASLGKLQALLVGGEALPPDLAKTLCELVPGVLLNMYGPTETTVWSSVARLNSVGDKVPLGSPIANTILSVRNGFGQTLPDGIAGELWIGGEGVTQGYWKRQDLTADRFVDNGGHRFYRTGDLVRRLGDVLEFQGRIDNQVKIRGHRIELGEIEAKLSELPTVRQGVVVAQGEAASDKRLVGYCVGENGARPDAVALRQALAEILPDFMVPSTIVVLEHFPMTPNGKIDRKALPLMSVQNEASKQEVSGDTEAAIAEIWREALGLAHVGVTDNFFDLGGHSLLVVQVQRRLKQKFGKEIPIVDMFRFSTIQTLAERLDIEAGSDNSAAKRGQERALARRSRMARRAGD